MIEMRKFPIMSGHYQVRILSHKNLYGYELLDIAGEIIHVGGGYTNQDRAEFEARLQAFEHKAYLRTLQDY